MFLDDLAKYPDSNGRPDGAGRFQHNRIHITPPVFFQVLNGQHVADSTGSLFLFDGHRNIFPVFGLGFNYFKGIFLFGNNIHRGVDRFSGWPAQAHPFGANGDELFNRTHDAQVDAGL